MSIGICAIVKTARYPGGNSPVQEGSDVEKEGLVEYYRQKLLERYAAYANRDVVQRIMDLLRSADADTLAIILNLLQSKK